MEMLLFQRPVQPVTNTQGSLPPAPRSACLPLTSHPLPCCWCQYLWASHILFLCHGCQYLWAFTSFTFVTGVSTSGPLTSYTFVTGVSASGPSHPLPLLLVPVPLGPCSPHLTCYMFGDEAEEPLHYAFVVFSVTHWSVV